MTESVTENPPIRTRVRKKILAQLFPICLLAAVFVSGQIVKRIEDERVTESYTQSLKDQRADLIARNDAALLAQEKQQARLMVERDARLSEQLELIKEQRAMIVDLRREVQYIAVRQSKQLAEHGSEVVEVKKARQAAQTAAKTVTDEDRAAINKEIGDSK